MSDVTLLVVLNSSEEDQAERICSHSLRTGLSPALFSGDAVFGERVFGESDSRPDRRSVDKDNVAFAILAVFECEGDVCPKNSNDKDVRSGPSEIRRRTVVFCKRGPKNGACGVDWMSGREQ